MQVTWVDTAKGFAIILVVFGHVWRGMLNAELLNWNLFSIIDARVYAFHIPLFFLLSGLFFIRTINKLSPVQFLKSRLVRLIYPLVLWTYIFIAFKLAAGSVSNNPISTAEFLIPPVPGRWHFWFLWALFVIHIVMLLIKPLLASQKAQPLGLALILFGSVVLIAVDFPQQMDFWLDRAIRQLPYFVIGMIIGRDYLDIKIPALAGWLAALVFLGVQSTVLQVGSVGIPYFVAATLLSLAALAILVRLDKRGGWVQRWLMYTGQRSMAIFLAHIIFTAGVREALMKIGADSVILHVILGTAAGLILPLIMHDLAIRLKLVKLSGF